MVLVERGWGCDLLSVSLGVVSRKEKKKVSCLSIRVILLF